MKRSLLLTFLGIALISCGGEAPAPSQEVTFDSKPATAPPPSEAVPATESSPTPDTEAASPMEQSEIARNWEQTVFFAFFHDPAPRIELKTPDGTTTITPDTRDSGKTKYFRGDQSQVAEVKPSDTGFKVRTHDGKLLWKVKLYDDKIKISDNEENLNPFEIKTSYGDKAKVVDASDREIGTARYGNDSIPTMVEDPGKKSVWRVDGVTPASAAWGVLLLDRIPLEQRAIIMAQLLERKR